jgi:hypothetical protein
MTEFSQRKRLEQERWRTAFLENQVHGSQNRRQYLHVLPRAQWELHLYPELRTGGSHALEPYLRQHRIKEHTGVHNLCSSWVLCANMYFPFRDVRGRALLSAFLSETLNVELTSCDAVELEYEHPDPNLTPASLLGEESGGRGTGQTSPDIAFEVTTSDGPGLVLVESKFTEHWFYECSGHKRSTKGREPNPDRSRCSQFLHVLSSPDEFCHVQKAWKRQYWAQLSTSIDREAAQTFTACPAAKGAYQILRQQALAESLAATGRFAIVVSAVAYDEDNEDLFRISTGAGGKVDLREVWPRIFSGRAPFKTFSHQSWVRFVRAHSPESHGDWLRYVESRYGYRA